MPSTAPTPTSSSVGSNRAGGGSVVRSDGLRDAVVAALPPYLPELIHEAVPGVRRPNGEGWAEAPCPFHEDENASFGVNLRHGGFICHATATCGARGDFLSLWGRTHDNLDFPAVLRDLAGRVGVPVPERTRGTSGRARVNLGPIEAEYPYVEADGTLRYTVVRRRNLDTGAKDIRQRRADGKPTMKGVVPLPYRLPELQQAIADGRTVLLLEGEKCVAAAEALGFVATTYHGGAGWKKWWPQITPHFTDADLVLLPDNDPAGREHMLAVVRALAPVARRIRWLDLPGLGPKEDLADWTGTAEELGRLIEEAGDPPVAEPSPEGPFLGPDGSRYGAKSDGSVYRLDSETGWTWHGHVDHTSFYVGPDPDLDRAHAEQEARDADEREARASAPPRFTFRTAAEVKAMVPPPWRVDGLIPDASFGALIAPPESFKSFLALDLGLSIANGEMFHGRGVRQGAVAYLAGEGASGLGPRIAAWESDRGVFESASFYVLDASLDLMEGTDVTDLLHALEALPEPVVMVVVDTFARAFSGDENSSRDVGQAIRSLDRVKAELGCGTLLVHHTGKNGESERGSSALRGACDFMLRMDRASPTDSRVKVSSAKSKDAPKFDPFTLELQPHVASAVLVTPNTTLDLEVCTLPTNLTSALRSLQGSFGDHGATSSQWKEACTLPGSSFHAAVKLAVDQGYVNDTHGVRGARYALTLKGRTVLTPSSKVTPNHSNWSQSRGSDHSTPTPPPLEGGVSGVTGPDHTDQLDQAELAELLPPEIVKDLLRAAGQEPKPPAPQTFGH